MKKIEIVAVWDSFGRGPAYVLGDQWDLAKHDFTDYMSADRMAVCLPDGFEVAETEARSYQIFDVYGNIAALASSNGGKPYIEVVHDDGCIEHVALRPYKEKTSVVFCGTEFSPCSFIPANELEEGTQQRVYGCHVHEVKDEFCDGDGVMSCEVPETEEEAKNMLFNEWLETDSSVLETVEWE